MKRIGRYEIVEELGRGAMGVVYKASDPTIGRLVALKVLSLHPSAAEGTAGAQEVFMREVRAAGRLAHPAIVTIHDAFEEPEGRLSCIVMELVAGRTLEKMLLDDAPLESERALEIARQVTEGLEYAHQQQVIHRDLKPANILVTEDGRAKITDFGIAKITALEGAARTLGVTGTPSFMSPEQVTGTDMDARSDLFSLGIILYLMLTGQQPFTGDSATVMFKIAYTDPVLPSTVNPKLTPALDYLILRCLVKDRNKRYSSARELLGDLEDIQNGCPPRSQTGSSPVDLKTAEPTIMAGKPLRIPPSTATPPVRQKSRTRGVAMIVILMVSGGLIGAGAWRLGRRRPSPRSAVSTTRSSPALPQPPPSQGQPAPARQAAAPGGESSAFTEGVREAKENTARDRKATSKRGSVLLAKAAPPGISSASAVAAPTPSAAKSPGAKSGRSSPTPSSATKTAWGDRIVQLVCKHDLKEGSLTVSSGGQVIFEGSLKGKKKGGFLGVKSSFAGTFARSIQIPANAQDLTVRVVTKDGSIDLSGMTPPPPPGKAMPLLQVEVNLNNLSLNWQAPTQPVR
jgi:serine/threonine-protein kinase